jgi:hypothetical protein
VQNSIAAWSSDTHSLRLADQTHNFLTEYGLSCSLNPCIARLHLRHGDERNSSVFHKKLPSEKSAERGNNKAREREKRRDIIMVIGQAEQETESMWLRVWHFSPF